MHTCARVRILVEAGSSDDYVSDYAYDMIMQESRPQSNRNTNCFCSAVTPIILDVHHRCFTVHTTLVSSCALNSGVRLGGKCLVQFIFT